MKIFIKIFILLFTASLFQACSFSKVSTLAKGGSVENQDFTVNIPFDYYKNLIFIEVEIDGEMYNFFLDTGAELNVIGAHIAENTSYKNHSKSKVSGSNKGKTKASFIELEQLKIDDIIFNNTGSIIMELKHLENVLGCKSIDGIIGNNLMRKANWQINYQTKEIIISDQQDGLNISSEAHIITMNAHDWGNFYLDGKLNGISSRFTFDTGYSGKIKSNKKQFDKQLEKNDELQWTKEYGMTGANISGVIHGYEFNSLVDSIEIEGLLFNNLLVSQEVGSSTLIGNRFFENYIISIDWKKDKLFLDPIKEIEPDTLKGFDVLIHPNYETVKMEIARVRDGYDKSLVDPSLSEILEINGENVSEFTRQELCDFWTENKEKIKELDTMELLVDRQGKSELLSFNKKVILPKM